MISDTAKIYSTSIGVNVNILDFAVVYHTVTLGDSVAIGEHSVIGRSARPTSAIVRDLSLIDCKTEIKSDSSICANVTIYEGVLIGSNTLIGDNSSILSNVSLGDAVLISRNVTINSFVTVGNRTRIMDNSHITGRVTIGDNVFISVGVMMANDNTFGKHGYNENVQGAKIEDYVSIGVGAIIMPNIHIGYGSVVAAGSVVKCNVPEGVIFAGNPAKFVSKVPKFMKRY